MRYIPIISVFFIGLISSVQIQAQDNLRVKTVGENIQLEIDKDGKTYKKSYKNIEDLTQDTEFQDVTNQFMKVTSDKNDKKSVEINLGEKASINLKGLDLDLSGDTNFNISIKTDDNK